MKKTAVVAAIFLIMFSLCTCDSVRQSVFEFSLAAERSRSHMVLKRVSLGDQEIAFLEREGPGETIVLLHGFAADKDNWVRFTRRMPEEYRILAIDLPGHGHNRRDFSRTYDMGQITEGFARTVEALGLDRFHLAGNSMGGYVATVYAARNPGKVLTLGLFDAAGVASPVRSDLERALARGENPLIVTSEASFEGLMDLAFHEAPFIPWPIRTAAAQQYIRHSDFNRKMWNDIWEHRRDVTDLLPRLRLPVFVIWGDHDRIIDVSSVAVYRRYLPQSETIVLERCGHAPMLERPDESAVTYATFLAHNR